MLYEISENDLSMLEQAFNLVSGTNKYRDDMFAEIRTRKIKSGSGQNSSPKEAVQQLKAEIARYAEVLENEVAGGLRTKHEIIISRLRQLSAI